LLLKPRLSLHVEEEIDDGDSGEVVAMVKDEEDVPGGDLEGSEERMKDDLDGAGVSAMKIHGKLWEQMGSCGKIVLYSFDAMPPDCEWFPAGEVLEVPGARRLLQAVDSFMDQGDHSVLRQVVKSLWRSVSLCTIHL